MIFVGFMRPCTEPFAWICAMASQRRFEHIQLLQLPSAEAAEDDLGQILVGTLHHHIHELDIADFAASRFEILR